MPGRDKQILTKADRDRDILMQKATLLFDTPNVHDTVK